MSRIPWSRPSLDEVDSDFVLKAVESTWISTGEFNLIFEAEISKFLSVEKCLLTSNGTTAIHLAFLSLGLKPGDRVGIPSFGYLAAANIAYQMGLKVIFYDVEIGTFNLDLNELARLERHNIKVLVVIQNYGNVCDMKEIENWGELNRVFIVEDAAESFGSTYNGQKSGSFGDISTLSFHATKTITSGEGGAVTTKHKELARKMELIRSHGVDTKRYFHIEHGHNFRMTNLQAALGYSQFSKKEKIFSRKNEILALYKRHLTGNADVVFQEVKNEVTPIIWAVAVRLVGKSRYERDLVISRLEEDGIETRNGFYTPYNQDIYDNPPLLPNSEKLSSQIIVLPSFTGLTDDEIEHISRSLVLNLSRC